MARAPPHPKTKISALARDPAQSRVPRESRNFAFGGRLRAHIYWGVLGFVVTKNRKNSQY